MDVLLIYPDVSLSGIENKVKLPPLGLVYIAAVLKKNNIDVEVLDMYAQTTSIKDLENILSRKQPKIVGITCLTPFVSTVFRIAKLVKNTIDAKVVVGGAHATALPKEILSENSIDYVVLGEGEYTMLELSKHLLKGENKLENINGIAYNKHGKFYKTKNRNFIQSLDEIPFPSRELLPNDKYNATHFSGKKITSIITSRGCPYNCIFCDYRFLMGPKFRRRSPENVVDEIEMCIDEQGVDYINFKDSTFTFDEEWIGKFCETIETRKIDIKWDCNGRVNLVTEEMLKKMKKAGCVLISYGIESGNQNILDFAHKNIVVKQSIDAVQMTKAVGIEVLSYFILGLPGENFNTIEQTIKLAISLESDYTQFSLATPFPGTPLFEYGKKNNLIRNVSWDDYSLISNAIMRTEELDYDDLEIAIKVAYKKYYWRFGYLIKSISKLRPDTVIRTINGFRMLLKEISN
jgi:anaerobic magnesium-protoporphyrin IX monomethyl ester cyclase